MDAYIDLVRSNQTTVMTPTARIQFDVSDPQTHTTGILFYTQGSTDTYAKSRLEISASGDVVPGYDGPYTLGSPQRRWHTVYSVNGVQTTSDWRSKDNVSALPYGLGEIAALRPVVYRWKERPGEGLHYGLIAQEVREVLPDLVSGDEEEGSLSMDYSELVPVLVKAVQEQQAEIDTQAEQLAALEARLAALEHGRADQAGLTGILKFLSVFGFGGLVLGAAVVAGMRRKGV